MSEIPLDVMVVLGIIILGFVFGALYMALNPPGGP